MKKVKNVMRQYIEQADFKRAIIMTCLFGIFFYLIDYSSIGVSGLLKLTGGANILDFEQSYSLDRAYEVLGALGEEGRTFYLSKIIPLDFFFAVSYMMFYASWMSFFIKKLQGNGCYLKWVLIFPVINMLSDWMENINIIIMLSHYPERLEKVCRIAGVATQLKFDCVCLNIIGISILLLLYLTKGVKDRYEGK